MNPGPQHWFPLTMISTTSLPSLLAYVYVDSGLKVFISFALAGLHNSGNPVDLRFKTFFPFWIRKTHKKGKNLNFHLFEEFDVFPEGRRPIFMVINILDSD
jgi:hypothetical protein